jgi:hypothetical protein
MTVDYFRIPPGQTDLGYVEVVADDEECSARYLSVWPTRSSRSITMSLSLPLWMPRLSVCSVNSPALYLRRIIPGKDRQVALHDIEALLSVVLVRRDVLDDVASDSSYRAHPRRT